MKLPKNTREAIYAAKGSIEIEIPRGEECRKWQSYAVEGEEGRLATIFVETLERRRERKFATVHLTEQPRLLAKQQGQKHPEQYTTSHLAAVADDPGEAVDEEFQRQRTAEGHANFAQHRTEVAVEEDRKAQARRARSELTESLEGLDEAARLAFLAEFQRMCRQAQGSRRAA